MIPTLLHIGSKFDGETLSFAVLVIALVAIVAILSDNFRYQRHVEDAIGSYVLLLIGVLFYFGCSFYLSTADAFSVPGTLELCTSGLCQNGRQQPTV